MEYRSITDGSVVSGFCVGTDTPPDWFNEHIFSTRVLGGHEVAVAIVRVSTGLRMVRVGDYVVLDADGNLGVYSGVEFSEYFSCE